MIDYFHNEVCQSGYIWVDGTTGFRLFRPETWSSVRINQETGERVEISAVKTPAPWLIPAVYFPSNDKSAREKEMIRYSLPLYRPYPRRGEENGEAPLKIAQPLVRKFAALEAGSTTDEVIKKESILSFANEYGLLGERVDLVCPDNSLIPCDSLSFWINHIHNVYRVQRLWDLLCLEIWDKEGGACNPYRPSDDPSELRQLFETSDEGVIYKWDGRMGDIRRQVIVSTYVHPDLLPLWQQTRDLIMVARVALAMSLDENLNVFTHGKVLFDTHGGQDLILRVVPNSLIGAIWWELARLVTGELRFRQCEVCGRWEDITDNRSDWKMHSKCRKRKWWSKSRSSRSSKTNC